MSISGGALEPRKRISIYGERAATVIRALAEMQGHDVVGDEDGPVDLVVAEIGSPDEVRKKKNVSPLLVLAKRRLRALELEEFKRAGANAVIDAESNVLDVAFAFSDLLFDTRLQLRRYTRAHGGAPVHFRALDGTSEALSSGVLVDVARSSAFILSDRRIQEGTPIEMEVQMRERVVALRGRVAFVAAREDRDEGIAVEFAIDDHEVAPKLYQVCDDLGDLRDPVLRTTAGREGLVRRLG